MFSLLFKYPLPVFTRGRLVFLSGWPVWLLPVLVVLASAGLAVLLWYRTGAFAGAGSSGVLSRGRVAGVWALQSVVLALLLMMLWQPAMSVAELSSRQNLIAVVVDNSSSMATPDVGNSTREAAALAALRAGVLQGLNQRFRTRLYTLGAQLKTVESVDGIASTATATHLSDGLQQLAEQTSNLPVGAVVLLSDGSENGAGTGAGASIGLAALQALRSRRIPVHTVALGAERVPHDVELEDVSVAGSAVANARTEATVSFQQHGYTGAHATITVRDGDRALAVHDVTLGASGALQSEPLFFPAGPAGAKALRFSMDALPGEENLLNNTLTRPVLVSDARRRILYVEGEPRWQFRFLRRAEEDDPSVQIVSMLRTSESKLYRQGISSPQELADGFPVRAEDLFGYSGIIIGSVDASYFTPLQQALLRDYVDRRGGGILFLGGRASLSDGGWNASLLNDLLPTVLPAGRNNFHRAPATASLTPQGMVSPTVRLLDDPTQNEERWRRLAYLADYQDPGTPRAGATVLAEMAAGGRRMPLLVTENYGNGRTAILASGGTWRWQMLEKLGSTAHNLFWQQLLRWLVAETPGSVAASVSARTLSDEGHGELSAQVHDKQFYPAPDAHVTARVFGPDGVATLLDITRSEETPGRYTAVFDAAKPGSYVASVIAAGTGSRADKLGEDAVMFQREDGVAENFHRESNRALLQQLARDTGGQAWITSDVQQLPRDIAYSEAGISVRTTNELWNMPVVFLLLLALPAAEWLLRRRWGVV